MEPEEEERIEAEEAHQTRPAESGPIRSLFTFRGSEQSVRATEPLVIFTDAILAIAATLLVFHLQIPADLRADSLRHALYHQWPTFVAIMVGYLWLAAAWLNTRRLRRMLRGVDHYATVLYLLMILTITLIPFMMLVLARTLGQPSFSVGVQVLAVHGQALHSVPFQSLRHIISLQVIRGVTSDSDVIVVDDELPRPCKNSAPRT